MTRIPVSILVTVCDIPGVASLLPNVKPSQQRKRYSNVQQALHEPDRQDSAKRARVVSALYQSILELIPRHALSIIK